MKIFDANVFIGPYSKYISGTPVNVDELLLGMDRYGIDKALVYSATAKENHPILGNDELLEETKKSERLFPAMVLMPHSSNEFPHPDKTLLKMSSNRVKAVWLFPKLHYFSLSKWSLGDIYSVLEENRVPIFIDFGDMHWQDIMTDFDKINQICSEYPELPIVLVRQSLAAMRNIFALMNCHKNLYIETSTLLTSMGLLRLKENVGLKRILFGSGLPLLEAGCSLNMVMKSKLSPEEKAMIFYQNLEDLLSMVKL